MTEREIIKYLDDNNIRMSNIEETKGTKKQWVEMYRVLYDLEPRRGARKVDLVYDVVRFVSQKRRSESIRV